MFLGRPTHLQGELTHVFCELIHLQGRATHLQCELSHVFCELIHLQGWATHLQVELTHFFCELTHLQGKLTHVFCELIHLQGRMTHLQGGWVHLFCGSLYLRGSYCRKHGYAQAVSPPASPIEADSPVDRLRFQGNRSTCRMSAELSAFSVPSGGLTAWSPPRLGMLP
jgi:hypothetical protein